MGKNAVTRVRRARYDIGWRARLGWENGSGRVATAVGPAFLDLNITTFSTSQLTLIAVSPGTVDVRSGHR